MDRFHVLAVLLAAMVVGIILFSLFTQGRWLEETYGYLSKAGTPQAYSIEIPPLKEQAKTPPPKKKQGQQGRTFEEILRNP
jgi:hypothetical protein